MNPLVPPALHTDVALWRRGGSCQLLCPWSLLASPLLRTNAAAQPVFLRLAVSALASAAHHLLPFQRVLAQFQVLGWCQSATPFLAFTSVSHSLYVGHVFHLLPRFWKPPWSLVCQKTLSYSPILCISKKKKKYSISHFCGSISNFFSSWRSALPTNRSHPSSSQDYNHLTVGNMSLP